MKDFSKNVKISWVVVPLEKSGVQISTFSLCTAPYTKKIDKKMAKDEDQPEENKSLREKIINRLFINRGGSSDFYRGG